MLGSQWKDIIKSTDLCHKDRICKYNEKKMSDQYIVNEHMHRRDYKKMSFNENIAHNDPFEQFKIWFEQALDSDFLDPNAFALSTADQNGRPSSRMVLLKEYDSKGFILFTNYESRKGKEIKENPYASMLFFWDKLERQIRIEGKVERIAEEESYDYFKTRPYTSRLGAWASKQSTQLSSRFKLMKEVAILMAKYPKDVPLPPYWGGFRLIPDSFEFWQGRESRLHDRIKYNIVDGKWKKMRLYP
jgi:pyridoxamine 5'-phosphate oxidase